MGNIIGCRKKAVKVMKIDGTVLRPKCPAQAGDVLRQHPGHDLLESKDVLRHGLRAGPLDPAQPLKPGRVYFLVELPRLPDYQAPRRAWSGALHVGARERLESLKLSRRSVSDLTTLSTADSAATAERTEDGTLRLRLRLPKAQVAKLVEESSDAAEAAEKIVALCIADGESAPPQPAVSTGYPTRKEKRIRFMPIPDEAIA